MSLFNQKNVFPLSHFSFMQSLNVGNVKILLLNGKIYDIICDSISTTALHIFETIIRAEKIHENYILGLCALIGGDFVFLPMDLKIYKVAPQMWISTSSSKKLMHKAATDNIAFTLYLRIKFFLPTLRMLSLDSRHTLYLQLRKSVLENHIICTDDDLITLGGLSLQAEVGDFQEEVKDKNEILLKKVQKIYILNAIDF
jgi:hypothetical protein